MWGADIDDFCDSTFSFHMFTPLILLALGLAFVLVPSLFAVRSESKRLIRLKEIQDGASESYFEERRDLDAYKPSQRFLMLWRILGAAMTIFAAGILIVR